MEWFAFVLYSAFLLLIGVAVGIRIGTEVQDE